MSLAWQFSPLAAAMDAAALGALIRVWTDGPLAPLVVIAGYVAAGFLMMPITLLIAATGWVFGPVVGGVYAIVGSLASALVSYELGRRLGRDTVRRLAGRRINGWSQRIARRGVLAVTVLRLMPVAPFTVVNVIAGASHVGLREFLIGSAIGMAPGIVLTVAFVDRLAEAIRSPSASTFGVLALLTAALVALSLGCRRWLREQGASRGQPDAA